MKLPTDKTGFKNLKWMYDQSDDIDRYEGKNSYLKYNQMMSNYHDEYGYTLEKITAAFCALSPNNDYVGNLRSLTSILVGLRDGVDRDDIVISTYNHCKYRAIDYLLGVEDFDHKKRGLKIWNFYKNILNPVSSDYITVDGHIAATYIGDPNLTMKDVILTRKNYPIIKKQVIKLASSVGVLPNQMQATIWFTRKRIYHIKYNPTFDLFHDKNDVWKIILPLKELPGYE